MNTNIHEFMLEWGPLITAAFCLITGFIYARMYSAGTQLQLTVAWITLELVILGSVLTAVLLENNPNREMFLGQFFEHIFLGILIPIFAGVGIFAFINPEKWTAVAEKRKYLRDLRGK